MKLTIKKSHKPEKKFDAVFNDDGHIKVVPFGAAGYDDFTKTKNEDQKERYINRHQANENFNDPKSAGSLSRWVLWNRPSLQESIKDFKRRFHII